MKFFKFILFLLFFFSLQSCGRKDDGYIAIDIEQQNETNESETNKNNNQDDGEGDKEGVDNKESNDSNDENNGQNDTPPDNTIDTSSDNDTPPDDDTPSDDTPNNTLKILAIGNSFTEDGIAFLPMLVKKAGIKNVTIAKMVIGGTSLQDHYSYAIKNDSIYKFYVSTDGYFISQGIKKFYDCFLFEKWDYIILQQVSQYSGMYETFQPYLNNLIKIIHKYHPRAIIGWQMTWAYSSKSTHSSFKNYGNNQMVMYRAIIDAVNQMKDETGISVIIPTGMVIQELRGTYICNDMEITRDGRHLDYGAGRYAGSCAWFETLIRPKFQVGVKGNTARAKMGKIPITDEVALLCQEVAENVVKNYYGN